MVEPFQIRVELLSDFIHRYRERDFLNDKTKKRSER